MGKVLGVVAALAAAGASADANIVLDPSKPAWKDQRNSRSAPDIGYAGANVEIGADCFDEFYVRNPETTWKAFQASGAHLVKEWHANERWEQAMAYAALKTDEERARFRKLKSVSHRAPICAGPEVYFRWRQQHGVKVLLCLEQYWTWTDFLNGEKTSDINAVKKSILAFVKWIVDNGFKDQVVGFELGNEPYFECEGSSPEKHAARWAQIVPEIKRIFPECEIGIPIAEYRSGNPDIAAVRARSTAVDKWFAGGEYFGFQKLNQWSGRFIVAFSNCLDHCSHVIYHFYGGDIAGDAGPCGYKRIQNFAKVFPEVKDKRVWITEWRERSDEDLRCHQMHSSSIFKAHYMMSTICQRNIDGMFLHLADCFSGGFNIADGKGLYFLQYEETPNCTFGDWDYTGRPRMEVGPAGPLFKIYSEALIKHPLIYDHGTWVGFSVTNSSYWSGNEYYDRFQGPMVKWLREGADPKKKPANVGNCDWVLLMNPEKTSAALLVCNSRTGTWKPSFSVVGYAVGKPHYRTFRCKEEHLFLHQIPGEPSPSWEEEYDGDASALAIPGYTIATIEFPIRRRAGK